VAQAEWREHLSAHEVEERLAGRRFHHGAHQVPVVGRVAVRRTWPEEKRVVSEDLEALDDTVVMLAAEGLVASLLPDVRDMPHQLTGGEPRRGRDPTMATWHDPNLRYEGRLAALPPAVWWPPRGVSRAYRVLEGPGRSYPALQARAFPCCLTGRPVRCPGTVAAARDLM
jgi:hypothetical protein